MPAPLVPPYAIELEAGQDAKHALLTDGSALRAGTMALYIPHASCNPQRFQSMSGSLSAIKRHVREKLLSGGPLVADVIAWGPWDSAGPGNITISSDFTGHTVSEIVLLVSQTFPLTTSSFDETFRQLINVFREKHAGT